jgi:D-alanine-D-alanine ligase
MNIVVLAGGLSPERDVSLASGCLIANALMEKGHRVLLADVYTGVAEDNFSAAWECNRRERYEHVVPAEEPDLAKLQAESGGSKALIGHNILAVCAGADVTFLALHGSMGENGQLQAVLETHGIPFTGTGYVGSLLAMDKLLSKELMRGAGIPTPPWAVVSPSSEEIPPEVGLPCAMKPCSCGSSVGDSLIHTKEEWREALAYARKYEDIVFVERLIEGREFSIGILDGEALPVIEIIPHAGFYDYKNKYQPGLTEEICPAQLTDGETKTLQEAALEVHHLLRLGDYSRIDFILDKQGVAYCLEANTLPGMTPTSLLPQEAAAAGIAYGELCQRLAELAVARGNTNPQ